jgi:hypothetical protein
LQTYLFSKKVTLMICILVLKKAIFPHFEGIFLHRDVAQGIQVFERYPAMQKEDLHYQGCSGQQKNRRAYTAITAITTAARNRFKPSAFSNPCTRTGAPIILRNGYQIKWTRTVREK